MPYIDKKRREDLHFGLEEVLCEVTKNMTAGDVNYIVTMLCKRYIAVKGENYQHYNDLVGALEGCKLELYRRQVGPYEEQKIKSNGDV